MVHLDFLLFIFNLQEFKIIILAVEKHFLLDDVCK